LKGTFVIAAISVSFVSLQVNAFSPVASVPLKNVHLR
jgi:hypothetical protein